MQPPIELQEAIDKIAQHSASLKKAREALSQDYREGKASPFSDEGKRLAYLGARLPATYAAVFKVLREISPFDHLLDLGAGPGTASWAAAEIFPELKKITLVEKSSDAISLGKELSKDASHEVLRNAQWIQQSVADPIPKADVAILSYVINELKDPTPVIERCWNAVTTLIIIEPGTPKGFERIRRAREQLISLKANILAPCPHALACPIQGNDWCHFAARVERTKLHRLLKEGSLGYEDEKFSYVIASKNPSPLFSGRIIRQPMKQSGFVKLALCSDTGKLEEKIVTRKNKESYRAARDAEWGDIFSPPSM
jgi:ribosomal protein RSM22 (predicted rRNA methylase)